ncbi:MAG: autotransporter outer membrane beta-barrel domain-containing protein, partial [Opitutaceae bacterium]|nr:autotransporter outer membrane beta-barrel domain-containing protein [Opitutaceae bacterium]
KLGGTNSIGGYHFTDFTAISGTLALYAGAELGLWSTDHPNSSIDDTFTLNNGVTLQTLGLTPGGAASAATAIISSDTITLGAATTLAFTLENIAPDNTDALLRLDAPTVITPLGTQTVNILGDTLPLSTGTYKLIEAASATFYPNADNYTLLVNGAAPVANIHSTYALSSDNTAKTLSLIATLTNGSLTWSAAATPGVWDNFTTANWTGFDTLFVRGDTILFDDTSFSGATSQTITVATEGVTVGGMTVNNSAGRDYTFAGGAIKNTGRLEKTGGGGRLTIGGTLAFTGTEAAGQTASPGATVRAGVDFGASSAAGTIFDSADGAVTVDLSNETGGLSAAALAGGGLQGTLLTGALTVRGADADVSGPGGDAAGLAFNTLTGDASVIATGAIEAGGGSGDTGGAAAALLANTVTTTGTLRFDTLSITGGDGAGGGDAAGITAQEITATAITLGGSAADSSSGSVSISAGNAGATGDAFGLAVGNASGDTLTVQNATIAGASASAVSAGTLAFDDTRLAGVTVNALDAARGVATELFSGTLTIDGALAVSASAAATGASVGLEIGDTQSGAEIRLKNTGAILATGDALAAGILTGPSAAARVVLEGGAIRATTADGSTGADYAAGAGQAEIVMTGLGDTLVFSPGAGAVFNNGGNALRVFGAETIEFANGATQWGADWALLPQAGAPASVATVKSGATLRTNAITNFNKAAGSTLAIEDGSVLFTAVTGNTPHVLSTGTFSLASNATLSFDLAGATAGNATALLELDANTFTTPFGAQKINLLGTVADGDTYLLLHAANATFGAAAYDILYNNSPLSGRIAITATNSNTDKTLSVKLTIQNDVLTWLGGAAGAERVWDVNTSANWIGLEPTFLNSDAVLFTSSAAGEIVVGAGGVTVKNLGAAPAMLVNGGVYVFTGADATAGIIGNGDFRIAGAATDVTFNTAAAFTGTVLLDAGRLTLGAGAGAGALAVSSGTLAIGAGGSLAVAGTASLGAGAVFDIVTGIGSGTALTASAFVTAPGAVINITGYDISGVEEFPTTPDLPVYTLVSASETLARNYTFTVAGVAALEVPQDESTFIALREILDDAKKVQATTALVWTNITPASAHGTFNIASGSFTLGSNLTDNTAATAGAGMNGWDGKTLSKTGAGTLVLAGLNTHTGPTRVLEGTLVNTGTITGVAEVLADAALGNTGKLDTILQTGGAVGNTGEIAAFTQIEGVADNAGAVGALTLTGTAALFNNIAGGIVTGAANIDNGILGNAAGGELAGPVFITAAGLAENSGLVSGTVETTGRLSNGVTGEITTLVQHAGSVENTGTVVGAVINGGVFTNYSTGIVTGPVLLNVGTFTNADTAIIAAPVTIASGARLVFNRGSIRDTITNAGIVEFNNTTALTLSTEIVGTGTFRKTAGGNLTITVPQSSFEGQVWIGSGTVILAAENVLSAAGEVLLSAVATSPGVLNMSGLNQHIRQLSGGFYQNRRTMVYFGGTDSTYATLTLDDLTDTATFVMRGDIDTGDRDRLILNSPGSGEHEIRLTLTGTTEAPALLRVVENTSGTAGGAVFTGTVDYQAARYEFVQGAGDGADNGSWFLADTGRLSTIGTILLQTGIVAGAEWHYAMDSQRQRLGELRTASLTDAVISKHGNVWMRAGGYRLDAGDKLYGLKFSEDVYEISAGADRLYKRKNAVAYLGLFMQGVRVNRDFDLHGTGESNTGGGGIYAGWVHNDGWYADVAGKYDVSKNKIEALADAGAPASADYRTRSSGLSLEVGRLMPMGRKSWMEMSLQAAVGWLGSTDYTTDTGIRVHGDQAESHQYRARLRVGTSRTGPWFPSAHIAFVSAETKDGKIRINRGELYAPVVDRTRLEAGAGIARALPWAGAQVYLDYEYAHASVYTRPWSFSLGYRQAW